jgi:hypothetical protein
MKIRIVVLLTLLAGTVPALSLDLGTLKKAVGLGGPEFEITIEHPPATPLKVTTVAVGKPEGQCSDGVATRVEEDFVNAGITVIDRQQFAHILAEHKLQVTAAFDQKTAAKIGALVGAQALLFIKVLECHTGRNQQKLYSDKEGNTAYLYTVQGTIGGSMRVVDLTSGKVLAAQRFEGKGEVKSNEGFADPVLVIGDAEKNAAFSVHKLLLPWKETKRVVFYGDSDCNLKMASSMLKAQDIDGALAQSEANLTECQQKPKVKPATLARAHYNLGLLQLMKDDFDTALANLTEAQKLQDSKVYISAIADCRRAKELAAALTRYEEDRTALQTGAKPLKKFSAPNTKTAVPSAVGSTIENRLARLEELRKKNLITPEEYQERRAKILSEI